MNVQDIFLSETLRMCFSRYCVNPRAVIIAGVILITVIYFNQSIVKALNWFDKKILTPQLKEFETGLTLAVGCFLLITFLFSVIFPTFTVILDKENIKSGLYPESMSLVAEGKIPNWVFDLYGYVDELLGVLLVWWILNIIHMVSLTIDQIKGKIPLRLGRGSPSVIRPMRGVGSENLRKED